jgi:hypothetical protein
MDQLSKSICSHIDAIGEALEECARLWSEVQSITEDHDMGMGSRLADEAREWEEWVGHSDQAQQEYEMQKINEARAMVEIDQGEPTVEHLRVLLSWLDGSPMQADDRPF